MNRNIENFENPTKLINCEHLFKKIRWLNMVEMGMVGSHMKSSREKVKQC